MSAAPVSKPDEPAEPASDADGWALLEGLRRRLDDQVALGRTTQAQVTQLAESIAALVAQQRRRSLWLNVNSFVAYLVFTILCGAGSYLLYRSRAHELTAVRDQAVGERDAAVRRADDALTRSVAREAAEARSWEVYQLLEAGKRSEAMTKLDALRDQPLSRTERAVLSARAHETQVMEVDAAIKAAAASLKAGRSGEAIKPLEAALSSEPPGARAATIHYYLGIAYAKTEPAGPEAGRPGSVTRGLEKAVTHLQAAVAGDVDQDDARFQLASVLDRRGMFAEARAEYDRFATAHPQSPLAVFALRRSATLARMPARMPPGAVPAPADPGTRPAPAGVRTWPRPRAMPPDPAAGKAAVAAPPWTQAGSGAASPPAASPARPGPAETAEPARPRPRPPAARPVPTGESTAPASDPPPGDR